jgi:hypothetical protein
VRSLVAYGPCALLALIACSKAADPNGGGVAAGSASAVPGSAARDEILDAWRSGGLAPSAFTPTTLPIGTDCASGAVARVDVAICTFATPAAAAQAQPLGLAWVGDATGMAQVHGTVLVAAADRTKADAHGKVINQLMKLIAKP